VKKRPCKRAKAKAGWTMRKGYALRSGGTAREKKKAKYIADLEKKRGAIFQGNPLWEKKGVRGRFQGLNPRARKRKNQIC